MDRRERVIWAAGFFDGEGSVSIRHHRTHGRFSIRIAAVQVSEAPLLIMQELWAGTIRTKSRKPDQNWRPTLQWETHTRNALRALREMRPWLVVKAAHADLAEEFNAALAPKGGRGNAWDRTEQASIFARMKRLNVRGVRETAVAEAEAEAEACRVLGIPFIEPWERE